MVSSDSKARCMDSSHNTCIEMGPEAVNLNASESFRLLLHRLHRTGLIQLISMPGWVGPLINTAGLDIPGCSNNRPLEAAASMQ